MVGNTLNMTAKQVGEALSISPTKATQAIYPLEEKFSKLAAWCDQNDCMDLLDEMILKCKRIAKEQRATPSVTPRGLQARASSAPAV